MGSLLAPATSKHCMKDSSEMHHIRQKFEASSKQEVGVLLVVSVKINCLKA